MDPIVSTVSPELIGFVLTLAVSLLIGIEREEHEPEGIGGVRTFPIVGLTGFLLAAAFPDSTLPFAAGLVVVGVFLALTHWANIGEGEIGITTETAALLTFALGAAAARGLYWLAIAAGVVAVILLYEKRRLEGLAITFPRSELRTLLRFLLLAGVILPVVPRHEYTIFELNPFNIWLVVVAVSGISYVSYLLRFRLEEDHAVFLAGLLGGAYSSTVTTVVLARQSKRREPCAAGFAGAIISATGMMYVRLWVLLALFAPLLAQHLMALFWFFGLAAVVIGLLISRLHPADIDCQYDAQADRRDGNPLEITSAMTFAAVFTAVLVATKIVAERFGGTGVLVMAAIMGAADVDPFILGLTQTVGVGLDVPTAALAVVIAAATNNLMKGVYALAFGSRRTGLTSLAVLVGLGALSVIAYLAF